MEIISAGAGAATSINHNFDAVLAASLYGRRAPVTTGLTWGYYGGRGFGNTIADGTLVLTASNTNYIVANRSTGALTVSTGTTNWNDSNYFRVYLIVVGASTVTSYTDYREFVGSSTTGSTTLSEVPNPQTGTSYTYLTGDNNKLVTHSNGSAIAGTLPQAGVSFPSGWWMDVQNRGAGTLTITPTTSTIDGAASLAVTTGQGLRIVSDGTNYFTQRGMASGGGGGGGLTNITETLSTAAPNNTVNVESLAVINGSTDVDLAIIPKGNGALMVQIPTGTAGGGNKRGQNAADFQATRLSAAAVASGSFSMVAGSDNTASGANSFAMGLSSQATATYSFAMGQSCVASSIGAFVAGGQNCTASGQGAITLAGRRLSTRSIIGLAAFGAAATTVASNGKRQGELWSWAASTSNATATKMGTDGGASGSANQVVLENNSVTTITGVIQARQASTGDIKTWRFEATVSRGANAAATTVLASTVGSIYAAAGAAAWSAAIVADTTNGALSVEVTGEASKTLVWCATGFANYLAA